MNPFKKFIYCCALFLCNTMHCSEPQLLLNNDEATSAIMTPPANAISVTENAQKMQNAPDNEITPPDITSQTPTDQLQTTTTQPPILTPPAPDQPQPDNTLKTDQTSENVGLKKWNDHLTAFLVKGAFWNASTNTPTDEWQTTTFDVAKEALTQSTTFAEEIKTSFLKTINQKFITVEKGTDIEGITRLISEFDKKIDDLVKELSPTTKPESTAQSTSTTSSGSGSESTAPASSGNTEPAKNNEIQENITPEEKTQQSDAEKSDVKKNKQQRQWQESLENLKTEGVTQEEATSILNETIELAQKIINSKDVDLQKNEFEILNSEFKGALEERFISSENKLYHIDILSAMDKFKSACFPTLQAEKIDQNVMFEPSTGNNQQPIMIEPSQQINQNKPLLEQKNQKPAQQQQQGDKNTPSSPVVPSSAPNIQMNGGGGGALFDDMLLQQTADLKRSAERERQRILQENQQAILAKNIQRAATQKVIADKAAAEKGILSSIAETVLGEWWTGTDTTMKNMQEFKKQQEASLITMVNGLSDPITGELLSADSRELVKTAYYKCQDLILAFNTKEFWDSTVQEPNEKWVNAIKKPLALLIRYEAMEIDDVITIMHETLKSKMLGGRLEEFEKNTRVFLENEKEKVEKEHDDYFKAKQKKLQEIAAEKQRAIERERQERLDRQNEVLRQERETLENMEKTAQQRFDAWENMRKLDGEWNKLLQTIASGTTASAEQNDSWTQEALSKTQDLLRLAPIAQVDTRDKVAERKAGFSQALVQQKKNSGGLGIDASRNMEEFNKGVHLLK